MNKFDKEKYNKFFEEITIADINQRKENVNTLKICALIFIPFGIIWFLIGYFTIYQQNYSWLVLIFSLWGLVISLTPFLIFCFFPRRLIWYSNILYKYFAFKYLDNYEIQNITIQLKNIYENSGILSQKSEFITDEILEGTYNELPFIVVDAKISKMKFHGFILCTKINRNFKCNTFIKSDKLFKSDKIKNMHKINLEDIEFEKYFDVYSTDQIEARYILTTAFIERLLNYRQLKNCPIEMFFYPDKNVQYNLFIFVNTCKNDFEFNKYTPMWKLMNKDVFYNAIQEIYNIFNVIDALKLEQNIGM